MNVNPTRIRALDGWRGIAILLVIIDHTNLVAVHPYGHLVFIGQHGVALFFVLSGYLITSNLMAERSRTGRIDLVGFYVRRLFRLGPASWLFLATMVLVCHITREDILRCLFFARNFTSHDNSFWTGHFWSLSIEEQFYLIWPALLLLLNKRARPFALVFAGAIGLWRFAELKQILAGGFMLSVHTQFRADALLIGCAAALTPHRKLHPALLALAGLVVVWNFRQPHMLIFFSEALALGLIIWQTPALPKWLSAILENPALVWLGMVSYSLYLWQEFTIIMFRNPTPLIMTVRVVLSVVLTCFSYYAIERPMIRLGRRLLNRRKQLSPAIGNLEVGSVEGLRVVVQGDGRV